MKTIAIYAAQAAMGVVGLAMGYAKLSGADIMVDAFDLLGLGTSVRLLAGAVEIVAGLCLLMPRGGVVGALLLATVVIGSAGITIGQVASKALPNNSQQNASAMHQAVHFGQSKSIRLMPSVKDGINI